MSQQTDKLFIDQFLQELFVAFQNKGGIIRPRCRRKTGVIGKSAYFPKLGIAPVALPKTRNGKVPLMELARDRVQCTLQDMYAADLIDSLDELKTNVNERQAVQESLVMSLARSEDDFGLTALNTGTNANNQTAADDAWTSDVIPRTVLEQFGNAEMMADGKMHALVSWKAWNALLALNSFVNSQYGGNTELTSEGQMTKKYFGFDYVPFSRLPLTGGSPTNLFFNANILGVAVGKEITPVTERLGEYDADQIMAKTSQGAVLIESTGVIRRRYAAA